MSPSSSSLSASGRRADELAGGNWAGLGQEVQAAQEISSTTANRVSFSPRSGRTGLGEVSDGQAAVGGQGDPGRDLQRQEGRDGEDAEADTDLPGQ
jgi:hypothetical protein